MPRYLIERKFHVAQDEMPVIGRRSRQVAEERFPEIVWEHSHVIVDDQGAVKTYCVYDAPSQDVVHAHAAGLGDHEIVALYEIAGDVTPEDFPLSPA